MVKVALIGQGYWGSKVLAAIEKNPAVDKVQVIDLRLGNSISDIDPDIDCAFITTPIPDHIPTATALLSRGIDCYIEKPLAETAAECQQLLQYQPERIIMVGHIFMYHPALALVKEHMLHIGKIKHVVSERLNWGIYQTKTSPLHSLLTHDASIINDLFAEDIIVTSALAYNFSNNSVPDKVEFQARAGDVTISVCGSWYWPERVRKLTVIGDAGQIVWDDTNNQVTVYTGAVSDGKLSQLTRQDYTVNLTVTPLEAEVNHFIECVQSRQQPWTGCDNAIAVADILDAVTQCLRSDQ
jgi:predicted dehydrogenase